MSRAGRAAAVVVLGVLLAHSQPAIASDYRWFWPQVELSGSYALHGPTTGGGFGGALISFLGFGFGPLDVAGITGAVGLGGEYYGFVGGGLRLRPIELERFTVWFGVDVAVAFDELDCTTSTSESGDSKEDCDYDFLLTLMPVVAVAYRFELDPAVGKWWIDLGVTLRYVRLFDDRDPLSVVSGKADLFDGDGLLFGVYFEFGGRIGEDREVDNHLRSYEAHHVDSELWERQIAGGGTMVEADGDPVEGARDACPLEREDPDGFADEDGCPDPDNDGDTVPDTADHCPDVAEDRDGYQDGDGCPDEENDDDLVVGAADLCPGQSEDADAYYDDDGCPDPDNDGDGILDARDACVAWAEDEDGFQDDDGCPDPDNDRDGIVDAWDRCPEEREVLNGTDDDDGCPDEGQAIVSVEEARIALRQVVYFDTDSDRIQERSYPLLEAAARTLHAYPQILLVRVEGHTDDRGSDAHNYDLSRRRAASVRDFLIGAGVAPERLLAEGFGETLPVATNATRDGQQQNRRVEIALLETIPEVAVTYYRRMDADPLVPFELEPPEVPRAAEVHYRWSVVSRPAGSSARDPSPVDSATPTFRADLAGIYTLGVNIEGPDGATDYYLRVDVLANEGLRVEMFWNPPERSDDPTDVDLHLLHPSAASWFSQGDCHWANCAADDQLVLDWDLPVTGDNPRLDLDDTDGFGPENINIDRPVDGRTYAIGVHYYSDDGYGPADVYVKVYCGETSAAPAAWFGPVRLQSTGDFWRVANVTWGAGVCAVTPLTLPDGRPDIRTRDDAAAGR